MRKFVLILATFILTFATATYATQPLLGSTGTTVIRSTNNARLQFAYTGANVKTDDGIVRICGNLIGTPHTSNRIDSVVLSTGKRTVTATDIDGVDFERYFQWEDDGCIPLEIDFPLPMKKFKVNKSTRIDFYTVHGKYTFYCK